MRKPNRNKGTILSNLISQVLAEIFQFWESISNEHDIDGNGKYKGKHTMF